jgi:hypothetical protein
MNNVTDRHRVRGKIDLTEGPYVEDHGILTMWVGIEMGGNYQRFGGLVLDKNLAEDYVRQLCRTFGVTTLDELEGEECYALYSFGTYSDPIEGIESVKTGRRFLHQTWRKQHFPETPDVLEEKRASILREIAWAEGRAAEERVRLATVGQKFVDWEKV